MTHFFTDVTEHLYATKSVAPASYGDKHLIIGVEHYVDGGHQITRRLNELFSLFETNSDEFEHRLDIFIGALAVARQMEAMTEKPTRLARLEGLEFIAGISTNTSETDTM